MLAVVELGVYFEGLHNHDDAYLDRMSSDEENDQNKSLSTVLYHLEPCASSCEISMSRSLNQLMQCDISMTRSLAFNVSITCIVYITAACFPAIQRVSPTQHFIIDYLLCSDTLMNELINE